VQYKTAAAASWTTVTTAATSLALSGLTASTTYNFQVASVCNTTSAYSTAASFTTAAANTTPTYCTSSGAAITDEYIQTVKLAKTATPTVFVINNNTPTTTTSGYSNFTATTVNVARGTAYTITVVPKWTATVYSEGYNVWIDYNRNGVFTDAGESVFVKAASTATPATGSFTIPTTATLGTTRMRVQMKYGANATSCEAFGYGEVEDYTLNIATTAREISPEATANAVGTGMIVYPNPTNEDLTVELTQWNGTTAQARLLDLMGREVQQFQMTGSSKTINVAQLPTGVYFISILTDDKQVVTQKFVKQ
jgi:hypothetical protein